MKKYTVELLTEAVENSESFAGVLRYLSLRPAGGTQAHIIRKIKEFKIDYSHFTGQSHSKGKSPSNKKKPEDILILRESGQRTKRHILHRALQELGIKYECSSCKIGPMWNNKLLTLQIDHKDGNWLNNQLSNLHYLCPNCHSQTDDFSGKGRGKYARVAEW